MKRRKKLRFANIEDIILVKKHEIQVLQARLNEILKEECENVEKCDLRLQGIVCERCFMRNDCKADSKESFAKADVLEEEMSVMLTKIKYLLIELFLSQHKNAYIEYHDLELFPLKT
ncbi:MAG: hypothetical protein Q7K11_00130 [Candidatus Berkelbacteria bacterium]|nr:hypothetical protein [Candidatus Berkelbacteria bacterium]